jgi:hypothetical protein
MTETPLGIIKVVVINLQFNQITKPTPQTTTKHQHILIHLKIGEFADVPILQSYMEVFGGVTRVNFRFEIKIGEHTQLNQLTSVEEQHLSIVGGVDGDVTYEGVRESVFDRPSKKPLKVG